MDDNKSKIRIMELREMMKSVNDEIISDQQKGLPQPELEKRYEGNKIISLPNNFESVIKNNDYLNLLNLRASRRKYSDGSLTIDELAFLLWTTQGVKRSMGNPIRSTLRTVPSAGARHPFETYLFINRVDDLEPGLYHYLALEHKLEYVGFVDNQVQKVCESFEEQAFTSKAAVNFVWTVIPYRSEWRYCMNAQKYSLIDIGHVCQNLYLACEAINCGTCAIGAYDQVLLDKLLGLNSMPSFEKENEFSVYAATVGKLN